MLKHIGKRTFSEVTDDPSEISKQPKMEQVMLSEDGTMKYDFMFSLQKIVMAKIASNLWMNQINHMEKTGYSNFSDIEDTVLAKVSQLSLPKCISQQLEDTIIYFGDSIFKWLHYHEHHIFCYAVSECSAADLLSNIMWTVRGRIDHGQTAKNILSCENSRLNDEQKYKLACIYCLEDEIALLAPKINVNEFYFNGISIDKHPMVYFWTAHFRGNAAQLNNRYNYNDSNQRDRDMSIYEYIMVLLITGGYNINDIPIKYMWNKLNEEEKAKHIIDLVKYVDNRDLIFSLLSTIQYELQQKVFKECPCNVLRNILGDWWWWGEYFFPTLIPTLNNMSTLAYWYVLHYINNGHMWNYQEKRKHMYYPFKSVFKQLWLESSLKFKDFIFQLVNQDILARFLAHDLNWERDIDIFELIFKDLSSKNKKIILSKNYGIDICVNLIQSDKWDLLDLFVKNGDSSEEDIDKLKETLIQEKGSEIAIHFLKRDAYDALKRFINWAFKSKDDIWKLFKHQSLY